MSGHLTRTIARSLAAHSGQPVTAEPRQAARLLATGALAPVLLTPTIEWDTYSEGEATFTLVIAAGPADNESRAQDKIDAAFLALHDSLARLGYGVDKMTPTGYQAARNDSQTWPAYAVEFTTPISLSDLQE